MMDAEHRRPFAAFLLISAFAFAIMANGLRDKVVEVIVDSGAPRPLISAVVPDILLGRPLRDAPAPASEAPVAVAAGPSSEAPATVDRALTVTVDGAPAVTSAGDTTPSRPQRGGPAQGDRGNEPTRPRAFAPIAPVDVPAPELPDSPVDVPDVSVAPVRGGDVVGHVRGLTGGNDDESKDARKDRRQSATRHADDDADDRGYRGDRLLGVRSDDRDRDDLRVVVRRDARDDSDRSRDSVHSDRIRAHVRGDRIRGDRGHRSDRGDRGHGNRDHANRDHANRDHANRGDHKSRGHRH